MKELKGTSKNITEENISAMKQLFPEAFAEGKIDFDVLRQLLGDFVDDENERYSFKWNGKGRALRLSQAPSTGTLRPCKEESKDWDTTKNLYIEGDNFEVLKLLQKSYYGKVKMIYIDPPYNTGNDFVYKDDFRDNIENYKRMTGQIDGEGHYINTNQENNGRFHTDWLNMMYPRLRLARNLLADDGVIFISIDDNENSNLRKICDEIFGESNFVAIINWKGRSGRQDSRYYAAVHEYIFCYAKNKENFIAGEEIKTGDIYPKFDDKKKRFYKTQLLRKWGSNSKRENRPNLFYPIIAPDGSELFPMIIEKDKQNPLIYKKIEGCWRHSKDTMKQNIKDGRVEFVKHKDGYWIAYEKIFAPSEGEEKTKKYTTWIDESNNGANILKEIFVSTIFDYPKTPMLINHFFKMANVQENDVVLDFFSGSATTAHAVMQLNAEDGGNRRFIMVQIPEPTAAESEAAKAGYTNICEIGKERIRRAGEKIKAETGEKAAALDVGFKVFKLDTSNLKKWNPDPENLQLSLQEATENFVPGRTELDVVYEILLKMGLELSAGIEERTAAGQIVYVIGGGVLIICLGSSITLSVVEEIVRLHVTYNSACWKVVFRDTGFASDMDKTNSKGTLRAAGLSEDSFVCV